ncbi:MAG: hypothetical protein JKY34_15335 [Kordiimonadaceae bacterium]|nr:hypothetical protein [Kordiimonadaceae bacterium]
MESLRGVITYLLEVRKIEKMTMLPGPAMTICSKLSGSLVFAGRASCKIMARHGEGRTDIIQIGLFKGGLVEELK